MIKAVIFDVGGVLIDNPLPKMITFYAKHLKVTPENFENARKIEFEAFEQGKISETEFWKRMCKRLDCTSPKEGLWFAGLSYAFHEKPKIIKILKKLKATGYKIAMLSDTEKPVAAFIQKKYPEFDVYVFSCKEGVTKPDEKIYREVLKQLLLKPEEAVFIDDKEQNVAGAKAIGMKSFVFENPEQVESVLIDMTQNMTLQ